MHSGKVMTVHKVEENKGVKKIHTKSCKDDMSGEKKIEELISEGSYVIEEDKIIHNGNIILQKPLVVGKSWNQEFTIEENQLKLEGLTTITGIEDNVITTETIIKNIEGYENDTYKEINTYEIGKGLINREYTILDVKDFNMQLSLEKCSDKPLNDEEWYMRE